MTRFTRTRPTIEQPSEGMASILSWALGQDLASALVIVLQVGIGHVHGLNSSAVVAAGVRVGSGCLVPRPGLGAGATVQLCAEHGSVPLLGLLELHELQALIADPGFAEMAV